MASKPGFLYKFPWEDLGNYKYVLFAPFAVAALTGHDDADRWCAHMCGMAAVRYLVAQIFISVSRIHALTKRTRIQRNGISFDQIDREDRWDDYILLQVYVATAVHHLPYLGYSNFEVYSSKSLWHMLWFHVGPAEFVYYWLHRALHHHFLFSRYHSHHHACKCTAAFLCQYAVVTCLSSLPSLLLYVSLPCLCCLPRSRRWSRV
jgi:hypothetical protein